jgi:hypothetical protein
VGTIYLFEFSIPTGLILGALLGLPLGLVLACWFIRQATPPADPERFTAITEAVGGTIALLINGPMNAGTVLVQASAASGPLNPPPTRGAIALLAIVAFACVIASAMIGRLCGHRLANGHLKRLGITAPKHLAACKMRPLVHRRVP